MEQSVVFWLVAIAGVVLTGISKSGFAGGIGIATVPILSLVMPPVQAAAIMLPLLILMDGFSLKAWWGQQNNHYLGLLIPPAIAGIVAGYLLFEYLNEEMLKLVLGVMSLLFALWGLGNGMQRVTFGSRLAGRLFGAIAGLTSFVAHAGGPPVNIYLLAKKLPKAQFLATAVIFFAVINVVKLVPYAMLNQFNTNNLLIAALLMPFGWVGVRLGLVIQRKLNDKVFYRIILVLLLAIGIKLIADAMGY